MRLNAGLLAFEVKVSGIMETKPVLFRQTRMFNFTRTLFQQDHSILLQNGGILLNFSLSEAVYWVNLKNVNPYLTFIFLHRTMRMDQVIFYISKQNSNSKKQPLASEQAEHCITLIQLQVSSHAPTNLLASFALSQNLHLYQTLT